MKRWLASLGVIACGSASAGPLTVSSPVFSANGEIPVQHTCEGADTPPALAWSGAPATVKSYALIVDDPDAPDPKAPKTVWVHWVLADIPASVTHLPADGIAVGKNDWGKTAWGGPCPPIGRHRYSFKVYALDAKVGRGGMSKAELLEAMKGHVVGQGELVGTYQKKK
jgi:Raf kinase inhibitor-like YbhB/YbcL family protein